jgi:hypothetical protein
MYRFVVSVIFKKKIIVAIVLCGILLGLAFLGWLVDFASLRRWLVDFALPD